MRALIIALGLVFGIGCGAVHTDSSTKYGDLITPLDLFMELTQGVDSEEDFGFSTTTDEIIRTTRERLEEYTPLYGSEFRVPSADLYGPTYDGSFILVLDLIDQAKGLNIKGRKKESLTLYSKALNAAKELQDEVNQAFALLAIGSSQWKSGDKDQASKTLQLAIKVVNTIRLYRQGDDENENSIYEKWESEYLKGRFLLDIAGVYLSFGAKEEAATIFDKIAQLPEQEQLLVLVAVQYAKMGESLKAIEVAQKLGGKSAGAALVDVGFTLAMAGLHEEAAKAMAAAVQMGILKMNGPYNSRNRHIDFYDDDFLIGLIKESGAKWTAEQWRLWTDRIVGNQFFFRRGYSDYDHRYQPRPAQRTRSVILKAVNEAFIAAGKYNDIRVDELRYEDESEWIRIQTAMALTKAAQLPRAKEILESLPELEELSLYSARSSRLLGLVPTENKFDVWKSISEAQFKSGQKEKATLTLKDAVTEVLNIKLETPHVNFSEKSESLMDITSVLLENGEKIYAKEVLGVLRKFYKEEYGAERAPDGWARGVSVRFMTLLFDAGEKQFAVEIAKILGAPEKADTVKDRLTNYNETWHNKDVLQLYVIAALDLAVVEERVKALFEIAKVQFQLGEKLQSSKTLELVADQMLSGTYPEASLRARIPGAHLKNDLITVAAAQIKLGYPKIALRLLNRALSAKALARDSLFLTKITKTLCLTGDHTQALKVAGEMEKGPGKVRAFLDIAQSQIEAGHKREALSVLQSPFMSAVEIDQAQMKQKFMLLMDVASSLIKAGDREASKEVLNSAHKVSLNFKEANDEWVAQLKLAQCYVAADDDEMARRLFNESLKIARASSRQLREKTEKQRAQFKGKGRNPYILQQKISVAGLSAPTVSPTEGWVALVYIRLGYIDQAIKLAKELGPLERAIVLAQLDSALIKEGDAKKAARIYSQGEALVERELNSIIKDMGSYEMEARQKDQSVIYLAGISWAIGYPAPALQLVKHIKNVETKKKFLIQLFEGLVLGQYVDLTAKLFPADFPNFSGQRYRYTQQTWQREAEGGLLRDFYAYDEPKNQHSFESNDSFVNFLSKPFTPREKKIASRLLDAFNATN